jgi:flavodoxin
MKVLIAYDSRTGHTESMARYIAEGVRFAGNEAEVKKITQLKDPVDIEGYDGYAFGSPTYHLDMIGSMKTWLFLAAQADLEGKAAGAFGSYTHSGDAPRIVLDTMQHVFKMKPIELQSFNLLEHKVDDPEGIRACQDYGRALGESL